MAGVIGQRQCHYVTPCAQVWGTERKEQECITEVDAELGLEAGSEHTRPIERW